jgi:hypothetical protein
VRIAMKQSNAIRLRAKALEDSLSANRGVSSRLSNCGFLFVYSDKEKLCS